MSVSTTPTTQRAPSPQVRVERKAVQLPQRAAWFLGRGLVRAIVLAVLALNLGVLVVVVLAALSNTNFLVFPPRGFTLRWFGSLERFGGSALYSFRIATAVATLSTALGGLAALALVRGRVRAARALSVSLLAPLIVPNVIYALAIIVVLSRIGWRSGFVPLAIALTVIMIPFCLRLILSGLDQVDWHQEAAARTLGATRWQAWFLVILPVVAPSFVMAWFFSFVVSFDEAVISIFMATPRQQTLGARLFTEVENITDPSVAAAGTAMIAVSFVGALFLVLLNWLRRRITSA